MTASPQTLPDTAPAAAPDPAPEEARQVGTSRNAYRVGGGTVDMRRPARPVRTARARALPQDLALDLGRTALIVVDMQNDFCHDDGWVGAMRVDVSGARALAGPINTTTAALRAAGVPVVWVGWGVRADRLNLSPSTQHPFNTDGAGPGLAGERTAHGQTYGMLEQGGWGAAIIDELVQDETDVHVAKQRISGFWDTPLDSILRNLDVTTLLFAGVNADHCVLATLMDASFHGYDTVLLEDCTATTSPDFCLQATVHNVRFCFGFTVTSADLVEAVEASTAERS